MGQFDHLPEPQRSQMKKKMLDAHMKKQAEQWQGGASSSSSCGLVLLVAVLSVLALGGITSGVMWL